MGTFGGPKEFFSGGYNGGYRRRGWVAGPAPTLRCPLGPDFVNGRLLRRVGDAPVGLSPTYGLIAVSAKNMKHGGTAVLGEVEGTD